MKWNFGICLAVLLALARPAFSQTPAAEDHELKMKEINQLLEMSHVQDLQNQMLKEMFVNFRKMSDKIPEAFWTKMESKMSEDLPNVDKKIADIYDRHFAQKDIENILAFYKTPSGQKFISELPKVAQESTLMGEEWGRDIGAKVDAELKAEGYE